MTNKADLWMGTTVPFRNTNAVDRSDDTALLIAQKPTAVIFKRGIAPSGVTYLPPQTVRLELFHQGHEKSNEIVRVEYRFAILIGMFNHPTIPNLDVQRKDRFFFDNHEWEVISLTTNWPYRILGTLDVIS